MADRGFVVELRIFIMWLGVRLFSYYVTVLRRWR